MKKFSILCLGCSLALSQFALGAQGDCQSLPSIGGVALAALVSGAQADQLLQINFGQGQVCHITSDAFEAGADSAASYHVNEALGELVVAATVEGYAAWLRVDGDYAGELLLDRATAEDLDLTSAEFLGDNSQLEASEFFVEFVGSLEIAALSLRNVETEIPALDSSYDHYAARGPKPDASTVEAGFLASGSLGDELLEDLVITLDIENQLLYVSDTR